MVNNQDRFVHECRTTIAGIRAWLHDQRANDISIIYFSKLKHANNYIDLLATSFDRGYSSNSA